jgi:transposase InsO family protein
MPYTTNPRMPAVRRDAARMVFRGHSTRTVARHFGYSQSVIVKWVARARKEGDGPIRTRSSRPKAQPTRIASDIRDLVAKKRLALGRSIEIVHHELAKEDIRLSISSVYRILNERYLIKKKSPWKRLHLSPPRPRAEKQGDLVQIDTIHLVNERKERVYVYTLIDVYSRTAFARAYQKANTPTSIDFLRRARSALPFVFHCVQSDNGPEFSKHFTQRIGVLHRHSRVRRPNDNAHLERFNRTLQEECLRKIPVNVQKINGALRDYLSYYNSARHHFALNFRAPYEILIDNLSDSKV